MGEIPASPPPPPPVASSASNTGAAMGASNALSALHGLGSGGGGNAGGDDKNEQHTYVDDKEVSSLGHDRTGILNQTQLAIGKMTLQAAFSHLRKNGEVMAPSPSDLAALKKALKEHGLVSKSGGARVENFVAAESAIEHLGSMNTELGANFKLDPTLDFPSLVADPFDPFQELMGEVDTMALVRMHDRGVLTPARVFDDTTIAADAQPESDSELERLQRLLLDPRAGFAPEGLAAWDLERTADITLLPVMSGRNDFTEAESGVAWSVIPLGTSDANYSDVARSAKDADADKHHVIVDANAIRPTPQLVGAIRNASTSFPKVRVHLAMNS